MPRTAADIDALNRSTIETIGRGEPGANWQTHPYHGFYTVLVANAPPFAMFSNNDCYMVRHYLWTGPFEPTSLALWTVRAEQCQTIVDIGANTGIYALAAAAVNPGADIIAFEPLPEAFHRLTTNIQANAFKNVQAIEAAVLAGDGETILSAQAKPYPLVRTGAQTVQTDDPEMLIGRAKSRRLDSFLQEFSAAGRVLIKIDVEGSEAAVLMGARQVLLQRSPDILIEIVGEDRQKRIFTLLKGLGYRIFRIFESAGLVAAETEWQNHAAAPSDWNWFATKDPEFNPTFPR